MTRKGFSQVTDLRVVPRSTVFRYKGSQLDPQEIGRKLGVRLISARGMGILFWK